MIDKMEVRGNVIVRAADVTIRNSIVRGRADSTLYRGIIDNSLNYPRLLVEDTKVIEQTPNPSNEAGVAGSNFTLRSVTIQGAIDSVYINGSNVLIEDSTLGRTVWYASHPAQNGGATHNDNIQVRGGDNITIRNNKITGSQNFAILIAPEVAAVRNLRVTGNFVDDGGWTVKLATKGGYAIDGVVADNRFGRGASTGIALVVVKNDGWTLRGNVFADDGSDVPITWAES